jgi:hypothetical protein
LLDRDELIAPAARSESSTATADPVRARTSAAPVAIVTVSPVLSVAVAKLATSVSLRLSNRVSVRLRRVVSRLALVPQPAPVIEEGLILRIASKVALRGGRNAAAAVRSAEPYRLAVQG